MRTTHLFLFAILTLAVSLFSYGYFIEYRPYKHIHHPLSYSSMFDYMIHTCFTRSKKAVADQEILINNSSRISTTSPEFVYIDPETSPMGVFYKSDCGKYYRMEVVPTPLI